MIEPYLALRGTTGDGMGLRSIWDQPHVRRVRDRYGIGRTRRSCEQLWPGMSVSPVVGLSEVDVLGSASVVGSGPRGRLPGGVDASAQAADAEVALR